MKNDNKKIITLSFVVAAFLVAFVLDVLLESLSAASGTIARAISNDAIAHGVPVAVGLVLFAVLQFNAKAVDWADEVITEISKVVWPSQKDTTAMTIVVCIMLVIAGFVLGFMDLISNYAVSQIIQ